LRLPQNFDIKRFVARDEELLKIHNSLRGHGSRRITVLHGLGGIGKTQLALAYAERYKEDYSSIFWLNIKDGDSLRQSFAMIAKQILREHPSAKVSSMADAEGDFDKTVDAIKAWLSLPNNTRWLMIYDNYDNPCLPDGADRADRDIRRFLPESYQGSVLITARSPRIGIGYPIRIGKLAEVRDGLEILSNTSRRGRLTDGENSSSIWLC
jgi:hypothetical protein